MGFHGRTSAAVLVLVVYALFLASTSTVSQPGDLISELCRKTYFFDLCLESVTENIKSTPTGISILNAEINASIKGVKVGLAQVEKLTKSASKQEEVILSSCKENYRLAIDGLKDAKKSIRARDRAAIITQLTALIGNATTCEQTYEKSVIPSPLKSLDERLVQLAGNSITIAKEIALS